MWPPAALCTDDRGEINISVGGLKVKRAAFRRCVPRPSCQQSNHSSRATGFRLNAGRDVARGGRVFISLYLCVSSCWYLSSSPTISLIQHITGEKINEINVKLTNVNSMTWVLNIQLKTMERVRSNDTLNNLINHQSYFSLNCETIA